MEVVVQSDGLHFAALRDSPRRFASSYLSRSADYITRPGLDDRGEREPRKEMMIYHVMSTVVRCSHDFCVSVSRRSLEYSAWW